MEQRSIAKSGFESHTNADAGFGYARVRGRLMMPTDLDKWSRDNIRMEQTTNEVLRTHGQRSADLHEFVACGGANAQRSRFTQVVRLTQDQTIAGQDDTLDLLICLQRPIIEIGGMNTAFSALQQHLSESSGLLTTSSAECQSEVERNMSTRHLREVETAVPSLEEFSLALNDAEQAQLAIPSSITWQGVSGFNLTGESWSQRLPEPNFDTSAQDVATVLPTPPAAKNLRKMPSEVDGAAGTRRNNLDIHSSEGFSSNADPSSGYYSAEE